MKRATIVVLVVSCGAACVPFMEPQGEPRARVRIAAIDLELYASFAGVEIGYEPSCRTQSRFSLLPVTEAATTDVLHLTGNPTTSDAAFALDMDGPRSMEPKAFAREVWVVAQREVRVTVYASQLPRKRYRTIVFVPVNGEDYEIRLTKQKLEVARHVHHGGRTSSVRVATQRSLCTFANDERP